MNAVQMKKWSALPILCACCTVMLSACSGVTPPIDAISTADMAINRALDAKAGQLAPLDLRLAREKLDIAKTSMNKEEYLRARRLAEAARVDARVAEARAKAQTAGDSNQEVKKTLDSLHHDVEQRALDH